MNLDECWAIMSAQEVRQDGDEMEITREMIEAGEKFLWTRELPPSWADMPRVVERLYRVMHLVRLRRSSEAAQLFLEEP